MEPSLARWQEVFDNDFPDGLVMRWDTHDSAVYPIPMIRVIGLVKDQPIVHLDVYEVQKSFISQIAGYTVVRTNPTLARVVAERYDNLMIWDGDVSGYLADA